MSNRRPVYVTLVILLALLLTAPQLISGGQLGIDRIRFGFWRLPRVLGFGGPYAYHQLVSSTAFWQDAFYYVTYRGLDPVSGTCDCRLERIDPETGEKSAVDTVFSCTTGLWPKEFDDRLWLVPVSGAGSSYELIDGVARPFVYIVPRTMPAANECFRFLWKGEPAYVEKTPQGFSVSSFQSGAWKVVGDVAFPDGDREWMIGNTKVNFGHVSSLDGVTQGSRIHLFVHTNGCLLHREGIELQPSPSPLASLGNRNGGADNQPVSALRPTNSDVAIKDWSLVWNDKELNFNPRFPSLHYAGYAVIGGRPAAMIVSGIQSGFSIGHIFRFDGRKWSEFATQEFPFGANQFRLVTCRDGQKAYIVALTSTGTAHVYAAEGGGLRLTNGGGTEMNPTLRTILWYGTIPCCTLVLGILLGTGTTILMWRFTKPAYEFGVQNVKLASLARRGFARLIDIAAIASSTIGLGWAMTRGFDWSSLLEAINLRVDHPTVSIAARVAVILAAWLVVVVLSLLVVQAKWGITPGKWLCGLRVLRTSLRPCGFALSLVRELILSVDAGNFLCWTPGIVSIALTDRRQRLGDLVADTIVVDARSLK
jgi:uncharacterized RDD family membrane protein YckC